MATDGKAVQDDTRQPVAKSKTRKPKSSVVLPKTASDASSEPVAFKVGQRVRFVKTGNIGKVTSVVTDQDGVVVNECKIAGMWYGFSELGEV